MEKHTIPNSSTEVQRRGVQPFDIRARVSRPTRSGYVKFVSNITYIARGFRRATLKLLTNARV